ncbi:MAG: PDZ domain-containing protein [Pirellulaceae bacterium]
MTARSLWFLGFLGFSGLLGLLQPVGFSADIYVNLQGDDSNPGTKASPVATLAAARDAARLYAKKEAVTVHVADGVYYLPETLTFTSADSGSGEHPIVYRADNEGKAVLSGGSLLNLNWENYKDGVVQAKTPEGLSIDQLFIDGANQRMARYPNYDGEKKAEPYQGFAADAFSKERAANWADPIGGYIHALHRSRWGGYHYRITGKDSHGDVTYEGGWQNNRQMGMHKDFRMVENVFEELDAPGEWFHDAKTSTLYFKPEPAANLDDASVEVVRLRHLIEFQGSETNPVKSISLQGFTVRHAARTFMDCKEQLLRSDWAIYRGGAFKLTGTEDVCVLDCEFDQVGGNAIFVNNYNRRTLIKGCHIHDCGASGVCFIGDPDAVRDPLFEYGQRNDLATIDRTPGPKTNNYPANGVVEDCLIHGIGRVERQPAGVTMDMASEISVRDCSIYDCARSGINIGDGAWGGHLIERCDVFDTVLETHDHGSFNSWGRDRYWRKDHLTATQAAVDAEPNLPFLDAIKTTVIRDSRWRCDHGWDIDLDDGSSNYDIYNNLLLNSGLKLREGFRRHAWNNVAPFGRFHPHVWFQGSKDQVTGNIFAQGHAPARMSTPYVDGTKVDRNFFASQDENILKQAAKMGWDANSVLGDPMFVDPDNGDFRVKEDSPALAIGFKNFPMDQFGVKKPTLKAIAKTPVIGVVPSGGDSIVRSNTLPSKQVKRRLLGALLGDLSGDDFSAYGVSRDEGGVAVTNVSKGSAAAKAGLRANDLIQAANGRKVSNIDQLLKTLSATKSASVALEVVRDQKPMELAVELLSVVDIETATAVDRFVKYPAPAASNAKVTANQKTNNDPLGSLTDGKLGKGYGPVFGNGTHSGAYKMDLGSVQSVKAITSWSVNTNGTRGPQKLTVFASSSATDPGWDLNTFREVGSIDTIGTQAEFTAASLRTPTGQPLGNFRWIVWAVSPVTSTSGGENTAFQELNVEVNDSVK